MNIVLEAGDAAADRLAERLRALGHPVRLAIIRALAEQDCCCGDVVSRLPLAQSTISQHLKVLREAGLLTYGRTGVRSCYGLDRAAFAELKAELDRLGALVESASAGCRAGVPAE